MEVQNKTTKFSETMKRIKKSRQLLILFIPAIIFYTIFRYGPMIGIITAFMKYSVYSGLFHSKWVGLRYFIQFFSTGDFFQLLTNTLLLGLFTLIWTFPFPIAFAVFLNEVKNQRFKKLVQTSSYLPSFLSIVIISSMVIDFLSPSNGVINNIIASLGFERQYFMIKPEWFRTVYIASEIWATMGYSAIIYLAAIAGIDPSLYDAAIVDGCGRFQSIRHITLPSIFPTISIMLILKAGNVIKIGFEKVLLLYNPMTYEVADIFSTYVYRKGMVEQNYSYAAAVGLFEAVIAMTLLVLANTISKKLSENSLW